MPLSADGLGENARERCGQRKLFGYVDFEDRVSADHPPRVIQEIVNAALCGDVGGVQRALLAVRPGVDPAGAAAAGAAVAGVLQHPLGTAVGERIDFDLLFRRFVGLGADDPVWDATTFTKNRDRLLAGEIATKLLAAVLAQPKVKALRSDEHFSGDGTLLEAWASTKSFRPKDGSGPPPDSGRNGERDFHGQKRSNETHAATADPDARLYRKSKARRRSSVSWGTR
jgi:hypothetical protein